VTEDWSNDAENSALITGINYILKYRMFTHSKNAGLFQPKFGSDIDKPNNWVNILNDIFNPTFGFVHILLKFWVKTTQHFIKRLF